ncbi:ABC transporter ATP-binding protein [Phormidium sp. CLA17]|uniref:ABC transporter ATP-binding protein n=1 Tax=Leptolyngbya sp. Cla-17 TaxID=2803751 RepID=UPI00149236E0|nr:ABC transporter ATP-binding protein [Leptolyngbya sp. Cla-17]MBM0743188.1 ABC transporter ATP-binding protein [Leptolyngbya sp. Cla-17]
MEAIRLDNVSLIRRTQEEFSYDLKKTLLSFLEGKYRKPSRRCVLDNISLVIEAGEKVGIIGSNGSGKSTLLKVICNILEPTSGKVRVRGTVAPLIELGAGFDSDMSVVENIVLYGVMLGFSEQEMRRRIPEILEFSELEDYTSVPVKALSSGMIARLGFAIATDIQPDILILDEVLSVGDESFRNKSKQRIEKFWQDHATILLVSHDLEFIQKSCQRVIWLEHGKVQQIGDSTAVIQAYLDSVKLEVKEVQVPQELEEPEELEELEEPDVIVPYPIGEAFLPSSGELGSVMISRVFIADQQKKLVECVDFWRPFYVGIEYIVKYPVPQLQLGFYLDNSQDVRLMEPVTHNWLPRTGTICEVGFHRIYAKIPAPLLLPGRYFIAGIGAYEEGFGHHYRFFEKVLEFSVQIDPDSSTEWFGAEIIHPPVEWNFEQQ